MDYNVYIDMKKKINFQAKRKGGKNNEVLEKLRNQKKGVPVN